MTFGACLEIYASRFVVFFMKRTRLRESIVEKYNQREPLLSQVAGDGLFTFANGGSVSDSAVLCGYQCVL